jgi:hypothetical protein
MPWSKTGLEDRKAALERYLVLIEELRAAREQLDRVSASLPRGGDAIASGQAEVDRLVAERDRLRDGVEEYLEAVLSRVVREEGLDAWVLIWPPVDFRLDQPPRVLVTSPRDRIERRETVLVTPEVSVPSMERIETWLAARYNLSAIVEATGGLATYPTVIPSGYGLLTLLEVAAHEWLHAYLFFYPLGQRYNAGADMTSLNETLADMAGREIGGRAFSIITGKPAPVLEPPRDPSLDPPRPGEFDFFLFMRETRQRTDSLLAAGDIEGAERYMEQRRVELNSHGYAVRKINQAYFAFHGSYGESPSSVSSIAREIYELRTLSGSAGGLVRSMRSVSSYEEFKAMLGQRRAEAAAR